MNVYTLRLRNDFPQSSNPRVLQAATETAFRKTLGGVGLAHQFSRVSQPDADKLMYVVCSGEAAEGLRRRARDLGIEGLEIHEGRTARFQATLPGNLLKVSGLK